MQGCAKLYMQAAEAVLATATEGEQSRLRDSLQVTRVCVMHMKACRQRVL